MFNMIQFEHKISEKKPKDTLRRLGRSDNSPAVDQNSVQLHEKVLNNDFGEKTSAHTAALDSLNKLYT